MKRISSAKASALGRWVTAALAMLLLGVPLGAQAVTLEWAPESMFIDDVPIGTTATRTLTLTARIAPVSIDSIEWTYNQPGTFTGIPQFGFEADRPVPATMLPGESMEIYISFTPEEALSFASANLLVTNSSANAAELNYWVEGRGVETNACYPDTDCSGVCTDLQIDVNNCGSCGNVCPVPANASAVCESANCSFVCDDGYEPLGDECIPTGASIVGLTNLLINYWNEALEAEPPTIVGFGPGNSAEPRRDAIENMLTKTREYVFAGEYDLACGQLRSVYLKTDGGYPFVLPPDFLAGEGVAGLHERVVAVVEELDVLLPDGCPLPEPTIRQ